MIWMNHDLENLCERQVKKSTPHEACDDLKSAWHSEKKRSPEPCKDWQLWLIDILEQWQQYMLSSQKERPRDRAAAACQEREKAKRIDQEAQSTETIQRNHNMPLRQGKKSIWKRRSSCVFQLMKNKVQSRPRVWLLASPASQRL